MKSITDLFAGAFLIVGVAGVLACGSVESQPEPEPEPGPGPDGIALDARFNSNRADALQTFSFDAATGTTVTGAQGTRVTVPANGLALDGVPVVGTVTLELLEVYDRASMLLNNRATNGVREDGTVEALKSAGQFFINATQDGARLDVVSGVFVDSRPIDPASLDTGMGLFKAGAELDDTANWEAVELGADGGNGVGIRDGAEGVSYSYGIGDFGWTNLDRWYDYSGEMTTLMVEPPAGYNGDNSALFLTYDGEGTALAAMDVFNEDLGMFSEHYGRIPVGQQVHFILVTEIDGELHYAIQGATIGADHVEVMATPTPGTQADLEAAINALP